MAFPPPPPPLSWDSRALSCPNRPLVGNERDENDKEFTTSTSTPRPTPPFPQPPTPYANMYGDFYQPRGKGRNRAELLARLYKKKWESEMVDLTNQGGVEAGSMDVDSAGVEVAKLSSLLQGPALPADDSDNELYRDPVPLLKLKQRAIQPSAEHQGNTPTPGSNDEQEQPSLQPSPRTNSESLYGRLSERKGIGVGMQENARERSQIRGQGQHRIRGYGMVVSGSHDAMDALLSQAIPCSISPAPSSQPSPVSQRLSPDAHHRAFPSNPPLSNSLLPPSPYTLILRIKTLTGTYDTINVRPTQKFGPILRHYCEERGNRYRHDWNFYYYFNQPELDATLSHSTLDLPPDAAMRNHDVWELAEESDTVPIEDKLLLKEIIVERKPSTSHTIGEGNRLGLESTPSSEMTELNGIQSLQRGQQALGILKRHLERVEKENTDLKAEHAELRRQFDDFSMPTS
ncbi:hypothetical protein K469DRAFT_685900 [Zopfia rhizophila CBS 207.26]|uniref:Uncharacterized protein n=1 Tax=Zopfia rhizophila CBS 207.26 TaxID=1314779 RepID=A0A6A6EA35_9PEZI|nr:hypothetical protein K469DRAFT_685900 [Zopfia rhizophila CBS 207.26]